MSADMYRKEKNKHSKEQVLGSGAVIKDKNSLCLFCLLRFAEFPSPPAKDKPTA